MNAPATIDLRSDTVTRPTPGMRAAIASAEVGDDVYGDDRTVQKLEESVAGILGHERGLFVPSGTMGNQIAIALHTRPGDEVVVGEGAHSLVYETGAAAALAGVQLVVAGSGGFFDDGQLLATIRPVADWYPRTSLMSCEDSHNRAGGRVWPLAQLRSVTTAAKARGLRRHLDGARLWNAATATGCEPADRASLFDSVTVCLSKGLGAPVGSVLCGRADFVAEARRRRKMIGGGMRQAGILAAAGLYALEHHRARLADDHLNARLIAKTISEANVGAKVDLAHVETNIVNVDLPSAAHHGEETEAERIVRALGARGILIGASGPARIRIVTHLDVDRAAAIRAAEEIVGVIRHAHRS